MISGKDNLQVRRLRIRTRASLIFLLSLLGLILVGCEFEEPTSIWDLPDDPSAADAPVITRIVPADSNMAGVGQITIYGSKFSPDLGVNLVFFDDTRAEIVSNSDTAIVIKTPLVTGDDLKVKISRQGAFLFSDAVLYRIIPSVVTHGALIGGETPSSITVDEKENVYASLASNYVRKIAPDGGAEDFKAPFLNAPGMKIGPGNVLYALWNLRRKGQISLFDSTGTYGAAGTTDNRFVSLSKEGFDLDFDPDSNLWVAAGATVVHVAQDGSMTTADTYTDNVTSVRVHSDNVYVIETSGTGEQTLWRSALLGGGTLGAREAVLDFSSVEELAGVTVYSFTFSSSGDIYLATDDTTSAVIVYYADTDSFEPLYPGLIQPPLVYLGWGTDSYLYASRPAGPQILKIDVRRERARQYSAPYCGRE